MSVKTYQDLQELRLANLPEQNIMDFIKNAINEHKSTKLYRNALIADDYYRGDNTTITNYQKIIYDVTGAEKVDKFKPNNKLASNFFYFAITQEVQYLLGNGIEYNDESTKNKLGEDSDEKIQELGKYALIGGVAFGFFNLNKIEVFKITEFVPLYDEKNGSLRSGIRWWQVSQDKPLRATLYEEDGYTEYIQMENKEMQLLQAKKAYKLNGKKSKADGIKIYYGENYDGFPIVPLWGNDKKVSELNGRRSTIDAYDIIYSNLVNNVSEGNLLFWLVQNSGGMDDDDLMMFRERIMTTGIASVDDNAGQGISVQSIEAPYNGGISSLEVIKAKLYEDFMALDVSSISSGAKTATEINAAYQPLDNKVDAFEYQLRKFFNGIFKIAGINDKVSFRRSRISNRQEELDMVLQSASYLDDDTITKLICNSLGIPDMYDEIIKNKKEEEESRYNSEVNNENNTKNLNNEVEEENDKQIGNDNEV